MTWIDRCWNKLTPRQLCMHSDEPSSWAITILSPCRPIPIWIRSVKMKHFKSLLAEMRGHSKSL